MADILAIVSKAVFEQQSRDAALGQVLPLTSYTSANKALEPLREGGALFLVTVRPPNERLWLLAILEKPRFARGVWTGTNATPVTDITAQLATLELATSVGIRAKRGALGMTLQAPRRLAPAGADRLRRAAGTASPSPSKPSPSKPSPSKPSPTKAGSLIDRVKSLGVKGARCASADDLAIDAADWAKLAPSITAQHAVRTLRLWKATGADLEAALATPELARVETLSLFRNRLDQADVEALVASPNLASVRVLDLKWCGLGGRTGAVLAAADPRRLPALREVSLFGNKLGASGVQALARSALVQQLTALDLTANHAGDAALAQLLGSPAIVNLETLVVDRNEASRAASAALLGGGHALRLLKLDLRGDGIAKLLAANRKAQRPWRVPELDAPATAAPPRSRPQAVEDGRGAGLVEQLARDPDAATRLAYADWLQEQGDVRGELMAFEARLETDPDDAATAKKVEQLRAKVRKAFCQRFKNKQADLTFEHGTIVRVGGPQHWFLQRGAEILASEPVREVRVDPPAVATMTQLAAVPGMQRIRWLTIGAATPKLLAAVPLDALPALTVELDGIGSLRCPGIDAYLEMPALARVGGLRWWTVPTLGDLQQLVRDPRLAHVRRITARYPAASADAAAEALLASRWQLERLHVGPTSAPLVEKLQRRFGTVIVEEDF